MTGNLLNAVAYYRVSTQKQGRYGYGLDAQKEQVAQFLKGNPHKIIGEFQDIESGKRADRPGLMQALAMCKAQNAILIIAKLDRLSRSVHFFTGLLDAQVPFRIADLPTIDPTTPIGRHMLIGMMNYAEIERTWISERTKAGLSVAKARGKKLGNPTLSAATKLAVEANRQLTRERDAAAMRIISRWQMRGVTSNSELARILNDMKHPTAKGGKWHPTTIKMLLDRVA